MKTSILLILFFGLSSLVSHAASPSSYAMAHKQRGSTGKCWRYVKLALYETGVVDSYPSTAYAKQAASELQNKYGFKKLPISDPYKAPVNAVIVYGGSGAGHVEIKTTNGFVSDFFTKRRSKRPVIAILSA